jgi:hypothetical protein
MARGDSVLTRTVSRWDYDLVHLEVFDEEVRACLVSGCRVKVCKTTHAQDNRIGSRGGFETMPELICGVQRKKNPGLRGTKDERGREVDNVFLGLSNQAWPAKNKYGRERANQREPHRHSCACSLQSTVYSLCWELCYR